MKSDLLSASIQRVIRRKPRNKLLHKLRRGNIRDKEEEREGEGEGEAETYLAPITSLNGSCLSIQFNDFSS
jgi:hypothetical protein